MIVIGVDVHKHSLTALAVDELGRERPTWSGPIGGDVLAWARSLAGLKRQLARTVYTTLKSEPLLT
jgi:hypothetical protein